MLTDLKRTLVEATVSLTVGVAVPGHARDRAGALPSPWMLTDRGATSLGPLRLDGKSRRRGSDVVTADMAIAELSHDADRFNLDAYVTEPPRGRGRRWRILGI